MGLPGIQIVVGKKAAGPTAPFLFYWHGTNGKSDEFTRMAEPIHQGIVGEGGVIVSFQNTTGGDLLSGTFIFGANDFKLADQLLACAVRDYNIDTRRIYVSGCSAGALFSTAMAAMRSDYIAAAGLNSGGLLGPVPFANKHTPAMMLVHGLMGKDVVVVDFAVTSATAASQFKTAGGFVIDCDTGGEHCGGGYLAPNVWTFFKAHPFGVSPEPWTSLPKGFASECKIK